MLRSSGLKLSQKYFVTRRIKTFMGCLNIFIIDLHQELLKDFSSSFKCNLAATTTCDKLQNTEYRILEATVSLPNIPHLRNLDKNTRNWRGLW
ncbi:uncharacterized protein [Macaca nemestrina]|uniref:uncharacterized protein isoform X4 n=1 Tax=Macaca nemestrina TaxID=9545 RepID=UPI0039B9C210